MTKVVMTGNYAQSYASKLARAQVVAAYPITPQTSIVEKIADFVSSGEMETQYIKVESEHSAMQACISAAALGARSYTATSSQGLLLMHELLFWAAGQRAPIIMGIINRAVAPPWSIWTDHTDSMAQRDTGWIQYYCESNQEVLDTVLQAYKVAEDPEIRLPAMVMEDAFYLSHTIEAVDVPPQSEVDAYIPLKRSPWLLDIEKPTRMGSFMGPDIYMEYRYVVAKAMEDSKKVIIEADEEYDRRFGRSYGGLLPTYRCDDADVVLLTIGTASCTAREVVDELREEGKKVGLARMRVFRPFPGEELARLASGVRAIGVVDRSWGFGHRGTMFTEVTGALYKAKPRPLMKNYVAGVGGRDITPQVIRGIYTDLLKVREGDEEIEWWGLRRPEKEVKPNA